jgi:glutaredoxin
MYSNEYCPDCQRARAFFETNAIPYLLVNLEENQMAVDFIMQVNHGFRCVPTIILPDGSILVEPTWEQLSENFFPT